MMEMDNDSIEYDNIVQSKEDYGQPITEERKSKLQDHIEWRRGKTAELHSQGFTVREIADILKVSKSLIQLDIQFIREQARKNLAQYNERLPHEFESVMTGITSILKRSIQESQTAMDTKTKVMCLNLAKECYSMKLDLLTNFNLLETAVKFLDEHKDKDKKTNDNDNEIIIQEQEDREDIIE